LLTYLVMDDLLKGRGAQINPSNRFLNQSLTTLHIEGLDEPVHINNQTTFYTETPKNIISRNSSPDIPFEFSINPYQGCEHGCAYCYARNSHEYWGFSPGIDFESKIIVKPDAPKMLSKLFLSGKWKPALITLSGNTDCYQPVEKKLKITRGLLKVFTDFRNPVSIITKNSLVLRDIDLLSELASERLVRIFLSVTTLQEDLRQKMEPRTAAVHKKLEVIEKLNEAGIPVGIMIGPVIPGLNDEEIPAIIRSAADRGASNAGLNILRLNGAIGDIFSDWLERNFPDRNHKIWNQVAAVHGGKVNDSEWGRRLSGEGKIADTIKFIFSTAKKKYMSSRAWPELDFTKFRNRGNFTLF
jgi:DNA repair photolyase